MKIEVHPIKALSDNYIWAICNQDNQKCICVDPGDAEPVLAFLEQNSYTMDAIFITHHHWDHTNGVHALVEKLDVPVYGPAREAINICVHLLADGDEIQRDAFPISFRCIDIPGHTAGHIAIYSPGILFCGDTLFTAGCGRVFEGTMQQMYDSLQRLNTLPADTMIYCGHEYTENNLRFARHVEPANSEIIERIKEVDGLRKQGKCTVPAPLSIERATNPFLRVNESNVLRAVADHSGSNLTDPVEVFTVLRQWKDNF